MQLSGVDKCLGSAGLNLSQRLAVLVCRPDADVNIELFRSHHDLPCGRLAACSGECRLCEAVKNQGCEDLAKTALRRTAGRLRRPLEQSMRVFEQHLRGALQMRASQCQSKVLPALQLRRAFWTVVYVLQP